MEPPLRHSDPDAHEPGCLHKQVDGPSADLAALYVDVFCACHHFTEPKILSNGSDVAWPAGWDQDQALAWRRQNGLLSPPGLVA